MDQGITFRGASPHFKFKPIKAILEPFRSKKVKRLCDLSDDIWYFEGMLKTSKIGSPDCHAYKKQLCKLIEEKIKLENSPSILAVRRELNNRK